MKIAENLFEVRQKIQETAERSGRKPEMVKIVAVSKTVSPEGIQEAYEAGQRVFGENRVQEWNGKYHKLPGDCEWHLIGRLQTNKVKYLNQQIALIHSLDRFNLLVKLNEAGQEQNRVFKTLLQVNVARDEAKAGLEIEEVRDFMQTAREYSNVHIQGLMTIGAYDAGDSETRGYFRKLREIRDQLIQQEVCQREQFWDLSMGMSNDYLLAVEEGATIIRVGSVLFGDRK